MNKLIPEKYSSAICIAAIFIICMSVFGYIFDPKLNLGGDNAEYYMLSTSIAQGDGYVSLWSPDKSPTSSFPPGYPLLMTGVRMFTDSIVAQKILNGLFLFGAAALLFLFIRRNNKPAALAFTAAVVVLLNHRVLEFATIMMSETSYLFFSALIVCLLWAFDRREGGGVDGVGGMGGGNDGKRGRWWSNPYLYVLILCAGYAFQIRTQGIAVVAGVAVWMLAARRWKQAIVFAAGFLVTTLPWTIRNHVAGLGSNRYLDQILAVNIWRPEEGYVSFGDLVTRGLSTLKMLLTKAIPNTVTPYMDVNYDAPATFGELFAAAALIALIIYGFRQYRRFFWFFIAYSAALIGIICLWSAPSGNRYLVTLVPILEIGLVTGVWALIAAGCRRLKIKTLNPLWLLIPAVLFAAPPLKRLAAQSNEPTPPAYVNYFKIAEKVRKDLPPSTVVCSRKPTLFYVYSKGCAVNYPYTQDETEFLRGLLDSKVEYVVLEQLGYGSTMRYLYPVIVGNPDLFLPAAHLPNPDTYLLKFDRDGAARKIHGE